MDGSRNLPQKFELVCSLVVVISVGRTLTYNMYSQQQQGQGI